jgi:hypothetical protein
MIDLFKIGDSFTPSCGTQFRQRLPGMVANQCVRVIAIPVDALFQYPRPNHGAITRVVQVLPPLFQVFFPVRVDLHVAIINGTVFVVIDCVRLHVALNPGYRLEKVGGYAVTSASVLKAESRSGSPGKNQDCDQYKHHWFDMAGPPCQGIQGLPIFAAIRSQVSQNLPSTSQVRFQPYPDGLWA